MTYFLFIIVYYNIGDYMKYLKYIIVVLFTILFGIYVGTYMYKYSEVKSNNTKYYVLEYGVYDNYDSMKNAGKGISDYFYYYDDLGYHIILGITENKNLSNKIRDSYNIKDNIYIKEEYTNNMEFLESLKQYDVLVNNSDNKEIVNAEKQIMSKWELLILNNE